MSKLWTDIQRSRSRFINKYYKKLRSDLKAVIAPVVENLSGSSDYDSTERNLNALINTSRVNATLLELYHDVGMYYGTKADRQIKKHIKDHAINKEVQDVLWAEWLEEFALKRAGVKFLSINETVRNTLSVTINKIVAEGQKAGKSIPEITRLLEKQLPNEWTGRAMVQARRIAQTEVVASHNKVTLEAIRQSGFNTMKTWMTAPPGVVVNERHTLPGAIQEYTIPEKDKFLVDGGDGFEAMDHPGDLNASAKNIINCMCTMTFEII